jgi:hypothetical protein
MPTSNDFAPDSTKEQRRKEVRRMIENLQGRRGAITKLKAELHLLEARRSLPVPYELLEHIFQYFVHSYGQLPEKLLLICRTFYVVAMGCHALWTGLDPVCQFNLGHHLPRWAGTFIQSRVARSNPAPLDIDFSSVWSSEVTDEFVKKIAGIPTLLQRCRSVIIRHSSDLQFVQGFQPLLESLTIGFQYGHDKSLGRPWGTVGECPSLKSLKLRSFYGCENWPDHLFQQLTHLEIMMPLQKGNNPSFHHDILPVAMRLRNLTLMVSFGEPHPVIHQSLQSLILVYRIPWVMEISNTLGEIVCPELRRLEIQVSLSELLLSIDFRHAHKLSHLSIVCTKGVWYDEDDISVLDMQWSDSIVEFLRSIGTIKHLELDSRIEVVSGLVEKLEADPTLSPDLETLHAKTTPAETDISPTPLKPRVSKRERSRLLKLKARISERYQRLGGNSH